MFHRSLLTLAVACIGCTRGSQETPVDPANYAPHARYEAMKVPADNPMTAEKAALGHQLFFDPRLSGDGKLSCYSCHLNEKGLSDGRPVAIGAFDKPLTRNSPTLWNIGYHAEYYWDGRAKSLEAQAGAAWKGGNMGAKDHEARILETINSIPGYRARFQAVFAGPATEETLSKALASYMRTIISQETPWDRFQQGDAKAVSEAAKRGNAVFEKAKCANCHAGVFFTDQQFHNVGIGMKAASPDVGRFKVTQAEKDTGAFKTPTLRDVADSGPYFHDGSAATLEQAVELMVGGGIDNPHLDRANLQRADLTKDEVADLIEFLKSLDEPSKLAEPKLP